MSVVGLSALWDAPQLSRVLLHRMPYAQQPSPLLGMERAPQAVVMVWSWESVWTMLSDTRTNFCGTAWSQESGSLIPVGALQLVMFCNSPRTLTLSGSRLRALEAKTQFPFSPELPGHG